MLFSRGFSVRRSFTTKLLFLSLFFASVLFYIKSFIGNESNVPSNELTLNNRKVIAGKLVNEYSDNGGSNEFYRHMAHIGGKESIRHYEQAVRVDLAKQIHGLGDNGKAASLPDPATKEIGDHQLATIALNEELSEHLSYNRTLLDARNPLCRDVTYDVRDLPTTSVVIIFYNEPYSVLVRTVHSVLNTCDKRILKEIILVDDCSSNEVLKGKLEYYIETRLPRNVVKIVRLKSRWVCITSN